MKYFIVVLTAFILSSCGTIKETTTTITKPVTLPAVVIHDTITVPVELPLRDEVVDSIGRWYLDNFCKGTVNVDDNGLKATVSFWTKTTQKLRDSLDNTKKTVIQLGYEIKKKEQVIQETKTTTETKSTPGMLWILWYSKVFWISSGILGIIIGVVGVIVLRMKTTLLKFIP